MRRDAIMPFRKSAKEVGVTSVAMHCVATVASFP